MKRKCVGFLLTMLCASTLFGCGKNKHEATYTDYSSVCDNIGSTSYVENLQGALPAICGSSATDNLFVYQEIVDETQTYAINSNEISYDYYRALGDYMKPMTANQLNQFEFLSYAVYLGGGGQATASGLVNDFPSDNADESEKVLFDYMIEIYNGDGAYLDEHSFSNTLMEAEAAYYGSLSTGIAYETSGNYLCVSPNALMAGLFGFKSGETLLSCYTSYPNNISLTYTGQDGVESSINAETFSTVAIGSSGTAIGYDYISLEGSEACILRDVYYLSGGGCLNGDIAPENYPTNIQVTDRLFFGTRSLGSLADAEAWSMFKKLTLDFMTTQYAMTYAVEKDCGCSLLASSGASIGSLLVDLGYAPDGAEINNISVSMLPCEDDAQYGDLYGWYEALVPSGDYKKQYTLYGFAILHSRDYGFSAENYLRIF